MAATAVARRRKPLLGSPRPRIAPPTPAKADIKGFRELAAKIGYDLWPWQETAARYMTATNADGDPLHREVCIVVARRNGKTTLLMPYTVDRILKGRAIMHVAQTLKLPGLFFSELVSIVEKHYPELIPRKRGVSWRAGQEELRLTTGGVYRLVAAGNGAARGLTNDIVMIDELREMDDLSVLAAIGPTVAHSRKRQRVYITNAGTDRSVCLKSIQARAKAGDPSLAYLEWSAAPERAPDDIAGWVEANPAIGHNPAILEGLEEDYRSAVDGGTLPDFETERLCRYQPSLAEALVTPEDWKAQTFVDELPRPLRSYMAVNMDPSGERASVVIAWKDGPAVCLDVHDTKGSPIDVDLLRPDVERLAVENRVAEIGFDPYTDQDVVRSLKRATKKINGQQYANATTSFVRLVAERKLRVRDPNGVLAEDLRWTTRKDGMTGSYMAVRSGDEHTNTAALAAVRAAWLASAKDPTNVARIF